MELITAGSGGNPQIGVMGPERCSYQNIEWGLKLTQGRECSKEYFLSKGGYIKKHRAFFFSSFFYFVVDIYLFVYLFI